MNKFKRTLIALCLAGAVTTACGSAEESSTRYINNGIALYEAGDYDKARLEFRNAIQINPLEAEGYYHLALLDERAQNWRGMYANLSTAESLDPNHIGAIIRLGQIELLSNQLDKSEERAAKVLVIEPDNIAATLLMAATYIKQKRYDDAQTLIDKALQAEPSNIDALSTNIMRFKDMGDNNAAIDAVNDALKIQPDATPLKLIKLEIYSNMQDFAGMESLYHELLTDFPNENWVSVALAQLLSTQGRYDDGRNVLEEYLTKNPKDLTVMLSIVALLQSTDQHAALVAVDKYITENPDKDDLRFAKIELLQRMGNTSSVSTELEAIIAANPESETGLRAKASLAAFEASLGNRVEAERIADEVLAVSSEQEEALLLKSKLLLERGEFDTAISNLRIITRNNTTADEAFVLIAQAYARTGSPELAESSFRRALTVNTQNADAALAVASLQLQNNDLDRAETTLQTALNGNAGHEALLQALTHTRILRRDWAAAGQGLQALSQQGSTSAYNHLLSAQMYQGLNDYTLALAEYEKALNLDPSMNLALEGLAAAHLRLGQEQEAVDYLKNHISNHPELLNGYAILANYYRQQENVTEAIEIVEKGLAQEPQWIGGYNILADFYRHQADQSNVVKTYARAVKALPEDNFLIMQLASSYEQNGEFAKARELYEQVLERDPSANIAVNNLASLLSDQFESPENLQRAASLVMDFKGSEQPYFVDTYGWVNFKLGNYDEARSAIEKAINDAPEVAVFHYHLASVYHALKLSDKAAESRKIAERLASEQGDEDTLKKLAEMN